MEFFTGDALFQTHDNLEHLAMMENVCAAKFDINLIHQVNSISRKTSGHPAAKYVLQSSFGGLQITCTGSSKNLNSIFHSQIQIEPLEGS